MVNQTLALLFLLAITMGQTNDEDETNQAEWLEGFEDYDLEGKGAIKIPRLFDFLQSFDLCLLRCTGKVCTCCHQFLNIVPVCASSSIDPNQKTVELSLMVTGRRIFKKKLPLNELDHICQNIKIKTGDVDLCMNVSLTENQRNPDSFRVCPLAEVELNKVKHLLVTFNCLEFRGDVIFDEEDTEPGKRLASVTILKPLQLANEIRKLVTGGLMKG